MTLMSGRDWMKQGIRSLQIELFF